MHINIEYCTMWNYEPRATSLAAEIRSAYPDAQVDLQPSGGGRFEVSRDGKLLFSKRASGRHAHPGEIVKLLAKAEPSL